MSMPSKIETVVIGAGHAGLTMSSLLSRGGRDHVVLERRSTLGGGWQDRWDSFCLVSPNWTSSFVGDPYDGADPDGFMPRDEIVARVAAYADRIAAPIHRDTEVHRLRTKAAGFGLETSQGAIDATTVVVATGSFHQPRLAPIAPALPKRLHQVHAHHYRNPEELPDGAVLVVGTGQTGMQLAEELHESGRNVYLSVGTAGRVPRRYRGRDIFRWLAGLAVDGPKVGMDLPTVEKLPSPRARLAGNPHLSGHGGGHDTNLREFAARGMTLLGRIEGADGERLRLAPDLTANVARADAMFDERFKQLFDTFIERSGIEAPPDDRQPFVFDVPVRDELDVADAGISSVLWTSGYRFDYGWLDLPIFDDMGFPVQRRGVTEVPGLYFLGSLWQHTQASATLFGPAGDGRYLARQMGISVEEGETAPALA